MEFVKTLKHRRNFRPKLLHRQFHLISTVLVTKTQKWVKIEKSTPVATILHCHCSPLSFNRSSMQASSRWRWTQRWRQGGTTAWAAAMLPPLFSTSFLSLASAFMLVVIVTIIDIIVLNFHGAKQIVGKNLKDCCSMMDFLWKPSVTTVLQSISTFTVYEEANAIQSYSRWRGQT